MAERVIFHVDVNSAFLSWEAVYRLKHLGGTLDLRTIPSAVGGDVSKRHGIILAKSIPAKRYNIRTGESVLEALRKCPELLLVPPNYNLYQRSSQGLLEILRQYTPSVEQYSVDEAFMDMSGCGELFGGPEQAAREIKDRIRRELGFTVNIGVAGNKVLAKTASDFRKPDRVHTLWKDEIPGKLWPLPVGELFFVGRATAGKLANLGVRTVGELAAMDVQLLRRHLKKHGEIIHDFANGADGSPVLEEPPPNKGYGNSTTICYDVVDGEDAKLVLLSLAETVAARLRADGVKAGVIAVGIRDCCFVYCGHQITLGSPTDITNEIYKAACRAFDELWDGAPIRHLGIHTGRIVREESRQLSLFDTADYEKLRRMDRMVDDIRRRFGNDALIRAGFLGRGGAIDHMSGGISREKRWVDYSGQQIQ